ncbi:MAG: hypothetical protein MJY44_03230 [Bacteroidales bacterium]|nr:hypothetical protein [Bacteroidales bacterium]
MSKAIGHIPIVSYIGKCWISFVAVTALCAVGITLCRKFLPKFTAQEDLIVK